LGIPFVNKFNTNVNNYQNYDIPSINHKSFKTNSKPKNNSPKKHDNLNNQHQEYFNSSEQIIFDTDEELAEFGNYFNNVVNVKGTSIKPKKVKQKLLTEYFGQEETHTYDNISEKKDGLEGFEDYFIN
jgi:hypothetical protein